MAFHTITPGAVPEITWVTRPWGDQEQYVFNAVSTVSLMIVKPSQRMSLQAHDRRDELWLMVDDGAVVWLGWDEDHLQEIFPGVGDKVWIPAHCLHRLGSTGPMVRVLEVAYGDYEQADITRYADDYGRPAEGE